MQCIVAINTKNKIISITLYYMTQISVRILYREKKEKYIGESNNTKTRIMTCKKNEKETC
jgi:hypothetical protein